MVNNTDLDSTFGCLANPVRRAILTQLAEGSAFVGELSEPHSMSPPAISRHLRVLEEANLIVRSKIGRDHRITINPEPIQEAREWMTMYARVWQKQFDRLDKLIKTEQSKKKRKK